MASPGSKTDARRGVRTPVDLEAVVEGRTRRSARVADLSLVGCLLKTDQPLASGAVLDVTLSLPSGPLRAKGRIALASLDGEAPPGPPGFTAGVEFLALSAADEGRLRAFLQGEAKRRRGARQPPA
jgi:hypothetical protein